MIKIADLLTARASSVSDRAKDMPQGVPEQAARSGAPAATPAYPSKKLSLENGRYVAIDHNK